MSFPNDDFMNFMGYRNMVVEEKIEECLSAASRGETSVSIDQHHIVKSQSFGTVGGHICYLCIWVFLASELSIWHFRKQVSLAKLVHIIVVASDQEN